MKTTQELMKELKLNRHNMTNEEIEALEIEIIKAENIECGLVEEVTQEINEKAYYFVNVTRIDTYTTVEFILNKVIDSAKTKKTLMNKHFNGKDGINDIGSSNDGKTSVLTYERIFTGKRLMILGMA